MNKNDTNNNIYIANAFISKKYGCEGSAASIMIVNDINNKNLMLKITQELNLPISVFLKKKAENEFDVRYFIYDGEEPTCGHGTIVAAKYLHGDGYLSSDKVKFNLMYDDSKYGARKDVSNYIFAQTISDNKVSIKIKTSDSKSVDDEKFKEISDAVIITSKDSEKSYINVINIVEGEFDFVCEIRASEFGMENHISSEQIIKSLKPNYNAIEKIKLSNGKLCRGVDVVIKAEGNYEFDYFSRIFLPLGASEEYKEDPACGSGNSYIVPTEKPFLHYPSR